MNANKFYCGKKILVTAGPTWVPVDRVRVLTSIFSGETGLRIARYFSSLGADITLLMGPGRAKFDKNDWNSMNIEQFFYYKELDKLLHEKLKQEKFDIIIHSSAVADYTPANKFNGKIPSGSKDLTIELETTEKLVDYIKTEAPESFLVKFKLQVGKSQNELLDIALNSLKNSNADLIVANDLDEMIGENHVAYILDGIGKVEKVLTKEELCERLAMEISERFDHIKEGTLI